MQDRQAVFDEVAQDKKFSPSLWAHSATEYIQTIDQAMPTQYGDADYDLAVKLKKNAAEFSAHKSAHFAALLATRTKEERDALMNAYQRQTEAEINMASRATRATKQWNDFERTRKEFPNLEYLPSRSAEKRSDHQKLYGIIRPIDDSFWNTHLPPNGWNCKCRVRATDQKPTNGDIPKVSVPKGIPGNPAKSKALFSREHTYFANVDKKGAVSITEAMHKNFEKLSYGKPDYVAKNDSSISVHLFAHKKDLKENFEAAKLIVDQLKGIDVKIRQHVETPKTKNPEYLINNKFADLKRNEGKDTSNALKDAIKKECEIVVFKMTDKGFSNDLLLLRNASDYLKRHDKKRLVKEIFIINLKNTVTKFKVT